MNKNHYQMIIESDLNELQKVEALTEKLSKHLGFSEEDRDSIAISITELVSNAISHGNKFDKDKKVQVDFDLSIESLTISVKDEGDGFDAGKVANPLEPQNLLKDSGRGIYIVRSLMDEVEYKNTKTGTLVRIKKYVEKC